MTNHEALSDRGPDEAAVRAVEERYDEAWNADDIDGVMHLLAPDVVVVNPYGQVIEGAEAFRSALRSILSEGRAASTHTTTLTGIRFASPDVAVVDGRATIEGAALPGPDPGDPLTHSFTDILVRREGRWLIGQIRAYAFVRAG